MVRLVVDSITQNNLGLEDGKEFLITTIGEIFSNAVTHSDEKNVYFMHEIKRSDDSAFLIIHITDYGKTIGGNVQEYQKKIHGKSISLKESMIWAMQKGHTTRKGSGGYGLTVLVDCIKKIHGELHIFSGKCIYCLKKGTENILESEEYFNGTRIFMKIPLYDTAKSILYKQENNQVISVDLDYL